jgi:hypothetical protein
VRPEEPNTEEKAEEKAEPEDIGDKVEEGEKLADDTDNVLVEMKSSACDV